MGKEIKPINNLIVNRGTYDKITQNLSQIDEDSIIITDDKTIPVPTTANNGQFLGVSNGEFAFVSGGGGALYRHDLEIYNANATLFLTIYKTDDYTISDVSELVEFLGLNSTGTAALSGRNGEGSVLYNCSGISTITATGTISSNGTNAVGTNETFTEEVVDNVTEV